MNDDFTTSLPRVDFLYPQDLRFRCTRCTVCCGDTENAARRVLLLKKEAEEISRIVSRPMETFATKTVGHEPYVYEMRKNTQGKCGFLEKDECLIYPSRPLICRFYPFELKPQKNGCYVFSSTTECQGLGEGDVLKEAYFQDLFRAACKRLHGISGDSVLWAV